uniref:hypothetical protein n=1 Tax=Proteus mirabilis TaxID=584 RepID=UPI00313ED5BF
RPPTACARRTLVSWDGVGLLRDEAKGIEDDLYPLTISLVGRCAVQQINVKPHYVSFDAVYKVLFIVSN